MGPVRAGLGLPEDLSPLRGCALSPSCCSLGLLLLLLLLRGVTRSKNLWVLCSTSARCFACWDTFPLKHGRGLMPHWAGPGDFPRGLVVPGLNIVCEGTV